jgi:hypothetical protein
MNEEELGQWILRKLGAPFWKVELTCESLADCIEDAKRWFTAKKGVKKTYTVDLPAGTAVWDLPDEVEFVLEVADSWRYPIWPNLSFAFGWDQVVVGDGGGSFDASKSPLSGLVQRMQYLQEGERILDAQFEWRQEGRQLLVLTPNPPAVRLMLFYKSNEVIIDQLSESDYDYVRRYALMCAKQTVGRIRSKYPGGFPGAGGQNVDLDGATLLQEAEAEYEKLSEDIKQGAYPMFFQTG